MTGKTGPSLGSRQLCTVCQEPVNQITRCERDRHAGHHAQCCPSRPPKEEQPTS